MTYQQYTHYPYDIIVKSSNDIVKNSAIFLENRNTISQIKSIEPEAENSNITIAVPGFINLHCHLAYSELQLSRQNLFPWLRELLREIGYLGEGDSSSFDAYKASLAGAREAISTGTTFLIDNSSHPEESYQAYTETGLKGIIGVEVFGSDPEQADDIAARSNLSRRSETETDDKTGDIRFAFSPHASYDVSPKLWKKLLELSQEQIMLSHVAESKAEEAWFQDKDSKACKEAKEFWSEINTLDPKLKSWQAYKSSIDYLEQNQMLAENLLLTHLCYASEEDLKTLVKHKISAVSCPRSNEFLNNGPADITLWEKLGLNYGLGTDSKASNINLDMRQEANAISGLSAKRKFELITSSAAEAIKQNQIGTLDAGQATDWVVLELNKNIDLDSQDIFEIIMDTELAKVKEVIISGEERLKLKTPV